MRNGIYVYRKAIVSVVYYSDGRARTHDLVCYCSMDLYMSNLPTLVGGINESVTRLGTSF